MSKNVMLLAALLSLGALATPASAEPSREVQVRDLDLEGVAGAESALRRIRRASEAVCGVRTGARPLGERLAADACAADATERAVAALGAPAVSAALRQHARLAQRAQPRS